MLGFFNPTTCSDNPIVLVRTINQSNDQESPFPFALGLEFEQTPPKLVFNTSTGIHDARINLGMRSDLENLDQSPLYMLPVVCVSNNHRPYNREGNETVEMGCPIVTPIHDKKGTYRRVGISEFGENPAGEFLCALGNQDASKGAK